MQTIFCSRIFELKYGKFHSCINNDKAGLAPLENPESDNYLYFSIYNYTNLSKLVSCSDATTHKNNAMANPLYLKNYNYVHHIII